MNDYTELLNRWSTIIAAALMGMAWVVVTAINRCCRHEYENVGDKIIKHTTKMIVDGVTLSRGITEAEFRQPVRCVKCGHMTWFKVG